ncbi:YceI family protein [Marinibactrum halimedae]|uniref:Polyisoprenoid-binding protein n=1 Tax=Marinibactrum halimedae TaxID=1444977 RepID=A0AA37T3J8_9GAMM|nr:YceI family protein [Marinibactrum halimedae]MCD9458381.1 YceI family protein [Marinibactrum halimedae]GLS26078.1 polyisoprenoid-binding protein [Marinibactrum halimedae]
MHERNVAHRKLKRMAYLLTLLVVGFSISACTNTLSRLLTPTVAVDVASFKPGSYSLDTAHQSVLFKVKHMGLSNYVGRFNTVEAELDFDPTTPYNSRLQAKVVTNSVDTGDNDIDQMLRSSSWFNSQTYPEAILETQSLETIEGNRYNYLANLTIKNIKKTIPLTVEFHGGAYNQLTQRYTIGFTATMEIDRHAFDLTDYPGLVGDKVTIVVDAEFQKQ